MKKFLQKLSEKLSGELHHDSLYKTLYSTDASVYRKVPLAVAYPKNVADIQALVAFAQYNKTSLIPRTAGTSLAGQCVGEGIVVDVSKHFTKIVSLNLDKKQVTVQPGVIRDELNDYLKPYRLFFGPNTSTSNRCMIGGMVGNNSSGTTSIQYGVTRDKVVAMETVLSNGEIVTFSDMTSEIVADKTRSNTLEAFVYKELIKTLINKDVKDEIVLKFPKKNIHRRNTGYAVDALLSAEILGGDQPLNLCKLLAGSEGTLAFTTSMTLQLDELPPPYTAMVVTHYESLENCLLDVVNAMRHELHTCEMMDNVILERTKENAMYRPYRFFVKGDPRAMLLLEVKAETELALEKQVSALQNTLAIAALNYHSVVLKGKDIDKALHLRKAGLGLLGNMIGDKKAVACIEDTAVALEDLPAYIGEFTQIMKNYNQDAVYYAHAGAGELHLRPILDLKTSEGVDLFRMITTDVVHLVKKYKGSFSGEHGDGIVRAEFIPLLIGDKNYEVLKQVKTIFDPNNIFNPGKIVDAYKMDESLRYETDRNEPEINTLLNFKDSQGILRLAEKCNGSGDCRKSADAGGTMCPSYHATKNEKDTTRARANMLREVLTNNENVNKFNSTDLKQVFDLCLSCKACSSECPSNVDIATTKAEFLYQYQKENGISFATRLFANSTKNNKIAANFPSVANAVFSNSVTASFLKKISGVSKERSLPKLDVFKKSNVLEIKTIPNGKKVILFVDEFSKYLDGSITTDAIYLLRGLNYHVEIIDGLDSARAMISKGYLEEAKVEATKNVQFLKDKVSLDTPLLGIEPSAILGFRDEYLRMVDDMPSAQLISENTFLIEEFLASEISKGIITAAQFTSEEKNIKIHVHCHQKAMSNQKVTFDILNLPSNYKPTIITSGCCGMAGSFGYEKEHYEVSMKIGELKLFPSIRKTAIATIIAANGTSCRHQIKDGTQRLSLHPISILKQALL